MLKNISSIKMIGILAVLVLVYLGIQFFGGKSRSKSFKAELVEIDTAKVTKVLIDAKGNALELLKENNQWKVSIGSGKYAEAQKNSVNRTLGSLLSIKPSRIAAKSPDKWQEYQVDTAGTRVQVYEGDKATLDLVIGRFGFDQQAMQRQQQMGGRGNLDFYTYLRLNNEDDVYVADNFMGSSISPDAKAFRNKVVLSANTADISEIQFTYPADSGFVLHKSEKAWKINEMQADSTSVVSYLNGLRNVTSSNFADDIPIDQLATPTMSMVIEQSDKEEVTIKAYQHPQHIWIFNSSENPTAYFADETLISKLFVGKNNLLGIGATD